MKKSGISISILRRTILFFALALLHFSFVFAQEKKDIQIHFENESVAVEKGSTFTNFLVIENKSSEEISIQNIIPEEQYPGLLFYPKNNLTLGAGQSKNLPVKLIANVDFMKLRSNEITFKVSYTTPTVTGTESASFFVKKDENKNIAIYTATYENFINPGTPDSSMLLIVENQGYSKRTVRIDLQSIPDGLEMMPRQQTVSLEGLEKQTVEIKIAVRKQNTLYPEFNINATATDLLDNKIVGSNTLYLVILSHNRQIARGNEAVSGSNFAEISYNENSSGFDYLQLRGNTAFRINENLKARVNVGADYYLDGRYNLYDTWLEVERKKTVLRLGNVNSNDYDYPVFGRGGKVSTQLGKNNQIEVLALENNYNLYGTYFQQTKGSTMAGAKYSFGNSQSFNGKVSYIFDHDPRFNVDTQVANGTTSFLINDKYILRTEVGLSQEKGLSNKDENTGALMGANYEGKIGKWDIQSINSFATKSYAGIKRGSFISNQRIGFQFSNSQRAFIQYQDSQVDPEFLSFQNAPIQPGNTSNLRYYFNSTEALGLGYQFSLKKWNFLLAPKVEKQKTASFYASQELFSYRLETSISTVLGSHGLNWTAEYSYSKANNREEWFNSLKTTLSYRYKSFSLNGTAQWNATSVFDLNSYYNAADRNFANYNLYASYNFQMMNNHLSGSFSAGASYSELYKNLNSNVSGNLEYKISPSWSSTGYFNFSGYKSTADYVTSGSYYQFRVGIKKYFTATTSLGNHKVTLQLFEDKNFNGLLETGESVLANEIVKLDNFVALTDKNGKVVFQNVPEGTYTLKVNESAGARLMMDPVIMVNSNINRKIGLVKNIRIKGKLTEIRQAYDVVETDVTGILVYAKSEDGKIETAVVNQKNEFEFFLKEGKYDLYIENDKYSYTKPIQTIKVTKDGYSETVIFEYKKKDTTIKVKKF
ncbi:hypothetical protein [Chryseobacterium sp.]|uniref:hypothetical protein n=1 Tax=Chryseobacterium sp. TaxID=1871047 RepID=UPI0025C6A81E|nr:hypothetical protein [Chryseobacterium sp.]